MIGKTFGYWTIIKYDGKYLDSAGNMRSKWICKCRCGVEKSHFQSSINSKSGSKKCKACANNLLATFQSVGDLTSTTWSRVANNAKERNHSLLITIDYAWELFQKQKGKCAISGKILTFPKKQCERTLCNASLDRINSKYGYIEGNVQWVDKDVNIMKSVFSMDYFVETCKLIVETANNRTA